MINQRNVDVLIIGGGAAGLFCGLTSGRRGRKTLVVDHAKRMGKKILMSGGGHCNFTNLYVTADNFLSQNPHFCKSALNQYTAYDFLELVERHHIPFHEKKHGQLFCLNKASDILNMLLKECCDNGVELETQVDIKAVTSAESGFKVSSSMGEIYCQSLVIATGGLSIPTMGATGFGYEIAQQFGHKQVATQAALVPFMFTGKHKTVFSALSGLSLPVSVSCGDQSFTEDLLFTHRGLSGPAILQISSYWEPGKAVLIDWLPTADIEVTLREAKENQPKQGLKSLLHSYFPNRFVDQFLLERVESKKMAELSNQSISAIGAMVHNDTLLPASTEGYRTAEVTLGGCSTSHISSKTMESQLAQGLYFIGEVLDVTGHLGGFNFQWAWSSGYVAGMHV